MIVTDRLQVTPIKCGPSGLANLEKGRRQTPTCYNNRAKRAKEDLKNQKTKKNKSILNYFKIPKAGQSLARGGLRITTFRSVPDYVS